MQDPVLFIGNMRDNLDPFGEFTDDLIWVALDQVQLGAMVRNLPCSPTLLL